MKRIISILAFLSFAICLLSCSYKGTYDDGYEEGYEDGEYMGYEEGYYAGIAEAQQYIAFVVDDDLWCLGRSIEKECGIHPEEAVQILSNYADVPDEVTEEELYAAIWAIYQYYYDSYEIINSIEDYDVD